MPDNNKSRLHYLYNLFIQDKASADEVSEFWTLLRDAREDDPIRETIFKLYEEQIPAEIENKDWSASLQRIISQPENAPVMKLSRRNYWWAAAAVLFFIIGSYFYLSDRSEKTTATTVNSIPNDIKAPTINRAVITLADGQKVYLDSINSGQLALQGKVRLVKMVNGEIAYQTKNETISHEIVYNTLSNPRGSKVAAMTMTDGTKVWLNAGSSLTYPVVFAGNERKVSITGEAYFEVAHNAAMPFKVSKDEMEVTVLGTHFNVNAYDDESDIKITLLEGSVKVSELTTKDSRLIKPGQQAKLTSNGQLTTASDIDIEQVMAWKNGLFHFEGTDLQTVMRQIQRWYDVEVIYEKKLSQTFYGNMTRQTEASKVFRMLELTGGVHFEIKGNQVIVKQ